MTRQLLQLIITAVAWAAGLGLVIGSIVLVVTATAPGQAAPLGAGRRDDFARQNPPPYSANAGLGRAATASRSADPAAGSAAQPPGFRVLAVFSGHGNRTTSHFHVRARRAWQLQWTYRCPAEAGAARFTLLRADMAAANWATLSTSIEENAASGHGLAWLEPVGQDHYFVVISDCSWRIKVVQATT